MQGQGPRSLFDFHRLFNIPYAQQQDTPLAQGRPTADGVQPPDSGTAPQTMLSPTQGAFAGGTQAIAELLGRQGVPPSAGALLAALGAGALQGRQSAARHANEQTQQDFQNRLYKRQLDAADQDATQKAAGQRSILDSIQASSLPDSTKRLAMALAQGGQFDKAAGLLEPQKPVDIAAGHRLIDPATGKVVADGGIEQITPYQQAQLEMQRRQMDSSRQLTPYQRQELALRQKELDGRGGNEPLVEIYDPSSPTGTKYVARSDAAGKPGKAPQQGLSVTADSDGRLTGVQMGGPAAVGGQGGAPNLGKAPEGYAWHQNPDGTSGLVPIAGGPANKIPAAEAGRLAGLQGGSEDADYLTKYFFPDGSFSHINAERANSNLPFTGGAGWFGRGGSILGGGAAHSRMADAVDTLMRLRTGAGMPNAERDEYLQRFTPSATDTEETARTKLQLLQRDIDQARYAMEHGKLKPDAPRAAPAQADPPPTEPQIAPLTQPKPAAPVSADNLFGPSFKDDVEHTAQQNKMNSYDVLSKLAVKYNIPMTEMLKHYNGGQ